MKNLLQKLTVVTSSLIISWGVLPAKPSLANLVFWDLEFFDPSGDLTGSGEFGYDPTTETFVQTSPFNDAFPREGFNVQSALEALSISLEIEDIDVSFGEFDFPGRTWWFDSNNLPGQQQRFSRSIDPIIVENSWFFGDNIFRQVQFNMSGIQLISETLTVGNWDFISFANIELTGQPLVGNGQWTATLRSIPEPTTTFGLLAFGTVGVTSALKRKSK